MTDINDRAAKAHARIKANVDAFYDDTITYEEFGRNARALWDEIAKDRELNDSVRALMLDELRSARRVAC
jgi:hypothetical protein